LQTLVHFIRLSLRIAYAFTELVVTGFHFVLAVDHFLFKKFNMTDTATSPANASKLPVEHGVHSSWTVGAAAKVRALQNSDNKLNDLGISPVVKGDLAALSPNLRTYILDSAAICQPAQIYICDGSEEESTSLINMMEKEGMVKRLTKYKNWYAIFSRHY
jgi:hypothetical protein